MFIFNILGILYIINNVVVCFGPKCALVFIPNTPIGEDHHLILFVNRENTRYRTRGAPYLIAHSILHTTRGFSIPGEVVTPTTTIGETTYEKVYHDEEVPLPGLEYEVFTSERVGDKYPNSSAIESGTNIHIYQSGGIIHDYRIVLDTDLNRSRTNHICLDEYENREIEVRDGRNTVGYVYRSEALTTENYSNYSEDQLLELCRPLVVESVSDNRYRKRSKYLGICITGNNNVFGNYRCFGLRERDSRLASISKPYRLWSSINRMSIINREADTYWIRWGIRYFHHEIKPEEGSENNYSPCYFRTDHGVIFGGRIFYVSDEIYDRVKLHAGNEVKNILNEMIPNVSSLSC